MELRNRILEEATSTFFRLGIKAVTMDDIASAIGVSKKTLYTEFSNKKSLVLAVMEAYLISDRKMCECETEGAHSAIEEMLHLIEHMSKSMSQINPLLILETYKYYPEAWALFVAYKEEFVLGAMKQNLKRGVQEKLYRKEIDVEIIARLKLAHIDLISEGNAFPFDKYNFMEVNEQLLYQYIYGICSIKGHQFINNYLKINE